MSIKRDEIKQWKINGWRFRKKTVKGNQYITRRKGKLERSLGRYNEKLWKLIENTAVEPTPSELQREAKKIIESIMELIRQNSMSRSCSHIIGEYCHYWRFSEKTGFFDIADNRLGKGYYRKVEIAGKTSFWVFKAEPFYCRNCSAYSTKNKYVIAS
jgi:hypothetical protein